MRVGSAVLRAMLWGWPDSGPPRCDLRRLRRPVSDRNRRSRLDRSARMSSCSISALRISVCESKAAGSKHASPTSIGSSRGVG